MNNKKVVLGVLAGVLIFVGYVGAKFFSAPTVDVASITAQVTAEFKKNLGSVTGPDILSPYLAVNNVVQRFSQQVFAPATTTACIFRNTSAASSTLVRLTITQTVATSTGQAAGVGQVTYAVGTTTDN